MDKFELEELAKISQITINDDEISFFLSTFQKMERAIENFTNLKIKKSIKPVDGIFSHSISLSDLRKNLLDLEPSILNNQDIEKNALIKNNKFFLNNHRHYDN